MTKEQIKIKVDKRLKEGSVFSRAELTKEYTKRYASHITYSIPKRPKQHHPKKVILNNSNKIAFLDFEFGQIYGSYRRDFLITETAVLIYDKKSKELKLGEVIFNPNINLVSRGRVKNKFGKYKQTEYCINLYKNESFKYDKDFKLPKNNLKAFRQEWNNKFLKKLRFFLNTSLNGIKDIYLFGGNEDINLLNKYKIKVENIIDIQTILQKNNKEQYSLEIQSKLKITSNKRYSLDLLIDRLEFDNAISNNKITFSKFNYKLPPKIGHFIYNHNNLKAHSASGDCLRLFCIYKELIEGFSVESK